VNSLRWVSVALWAAAALASTAALGVVGAQAGPWPEWAHLLGHLVLCGGCAAMVAMASRGSDTVRASVGLAAGVILGVAIEVLQVGFQPGFEVIHDLALDLTGASAGILAWGSLHPARAYSVGHVLSWALHPVWLAPVALFGLAYAAARDEHAALRFALTALVCLVPGIAVWLLGWRLGWWSDPDLSVRTERPSLFAVGMLGALTFVWLVADEDPALQRLSLLGTAAASIGVLATALGLKLSGHVVIPAAIGLGMVAFSHRGPLLLLGPALVLSWARIVADRHHWIEVLAAWLLAAAGGFVVWYFAG
jgi:hypothetical protein